MKSVANTVLDHARHNLERAHAGIFSVENELPIDSHERVDLFETRVHINNALNKLRKCADDAARQWQETSQQQGDRNKGD